MYTRLHDAALDKEPMTPLIHRARPARLPTNLRCTLSFAVLVALCAPVQAGRPLTVDDAGVNDTGNGHVEAWATHRRGGSGSLNLSPAYAPADGYEIGGLLGLDTGDGSTFSAIQLKMRFTPSRERGCNVGAVVGIGFASADSSETPYLNGLLTCDTDIGSVNVNLGTLHESGTGYLPTWGVSLERPIDAFVGHVEMFGQRNDKPTLQIGLRRDIGSGWQIDGTLGRQDRGTLFSLGLKRSF
jgi:hypothetical protein